MEVLACRVCLAMDTKLLSLSEDNILSIFEDLVGVSLSQNNVLSKQICELCKARLLGFANFKQWCRHTQALLDNKLAEDSFIPKEFMRDINKIFPRANLSVAKLLEVHINGATNKQKKQDLDDISLLKVVLERVDDNTSYSDEDMKEEMFPVHDIKTEANYEQYEELDEDLIDNYETVDTDTIENILESKIKKRHSKIENLHSNPNTRQVKTEKSEVTKHFVEIDCGKIVNVGHTTKKVVLKKDGRNKTPVVCNGTGKDKGTKRQYKKRIDVKTPKWPVRRKYREWLEALKAMSEDNLKKYDMKLNRVLTKEEQIAKMLSRKDTDMYKTSLFKCESCCKGFMSEKAFNRHALAHQPSPKRPVECPLCHVFLGARSMKAHERHHRLELVCLKCGDRVDSSKVKTHYDFHQGVKYECKECCKTFFHNSTYRNHIRIHHADAACALCGELYNGRHGVTTHIRKSHAEEAKEQCEACEHYFCTKEALQRHLEDCSSNNSPCGRCGVVFASVGELAAHIPEEHNTRTTETHYCIECSSSFSSELKLAGHWRRVHHDRSRARGRGGATPKPSAAKPKGAVKAKKPPPKILPTICDQCGVSVYSNYLPMHMLRHTGEKPHQCPICDKGFRIKQALAVHMMIHRGEKPFKCSECSTAFRQSSHLTRHMRVHTGEKPFSCEVCLKAFSIKENKEEHVRTVHEGAPPRRRNRGGRGGGGGVAGSGDGAG